MEYRCQWNSENDADNKLELIGVKTVIFQGKYELEENNFSPLYNDKNDIIGTQWNTDGFRVQFVTMKQTEYQFHTDITSSGYKKYYKEDSLDDL